MTWEQDTVPQPGQVSRSNSAWAVQADVHGSRQASNHRLSRLEELAGDIRGKG